MLAEMSKTALETDHVIASRIPYIDLNKFLLSASVLLFRKRTNFQCLRDLITN